MRDALTAIADLATRHGETAAIVMIGAGVLFILVTIWSWTRAMNQAAKGEPDSHRGADPNHPQRGASLERLAAVDVDTPAPQTDPDPVVDAPVHSGLPRSALRQEDRTPTLRPAPNAPALRAATPSIAPTARAITQSAPTTNQADHRAAEAGPVRAAAITAVAAAPQPPPAAPRADGRALGDAVAATPPSIVLLTVPDDRDRAETLGLALTATGLALVEVVEVRDGATAIATSASARADCVVALWSAASTELMRRPTPLVHVAREALRHGSLQAAMIDPTPTPLGFGHIGAFDLTLWAGDPNATSFRVFAQTLRRRGEENRRRRLRSGVVPPPPVEISDAAGSAVTERFGATAAGRGARIDLDASSVADPSARDGRSPETSAPSPRPAEDTGLTDLVRAIETLARNARAPDQAAQAPGSPVRAARAEPPSSPAAARAARPLAAASTPADAPPAARTTETVPRPSNDTGRGIALVSSRLGAPPTDPVRSRESAPSPAPSDEKLDLAGADCTIFAPRSAVAGDPVTVSVVLHAPQDAFEAADLARGAEDAPVSPQPHGAGLPLEVRLDAAGFAVEKPVQRLVWAGGPAIARFAGVFTADAKPTRRVTMHVRAFAEGAPYGVGAATITVSNPVEGEEPVVHGEPGGWPLKRHRTAYLCFADADIAAVTAHAAALRRLGVEVEDDNLTLNAKDRWGKSLQNRITRTDLVLVYWSREASDSKFVCREAEFAQRAQTLGGGRPDIVPVILEPVGSAPKGYDPGVFEDPIRALLWDAGAARAY